jgi:hypothetical protein
LTTSFPAGQANARFLEEAWALVQENSLLLSLLLRPGFFEAQKLSQSLNL